MRADCGIGHKHTNYTKQVHYTVLLQYKILLMFHIQYFASFLSLFVLCDVHAALHGKIFKFPCERAYVSANHGHFCTTLFGYFTSSINYGHYGSVYSRKECCLFSMPSSQQPPLHLPKSGLPALLECSLSDCLSG